MTDIGAPCRENPATQRIMDVFCFADQVTLYDIKGSAHHRPRFLVISDHGKVSW